MKRAIMILTVLFLYAVSAQATLLTFKKVKTNKDIKPGWGSNIAAAENGISVANGATPNIALTWSAKTPGDGWQFYNDKEWSAAQMDGFKSKAIFDLLFTPAAGYLVQVHSFVFDDYFDKDADPHKGSAGTWQLFQGDASGALINDGTIGTGNGENLGIDTGMDDPYAGPVLLRLIGGDFDTNLRQRSSKGGDGGKYQALDSIYFTEAEAAPKPVPEPATILFLGIGIAGFAGYRRFKK